MGYRFEGQLANLFTPTEMDFHSPTLIISPACRLYTIFPIKHHFFSAVCILPHPNSAQSRGDASPIFEHAVFDNLTVRPRPRWCDSGIQSMPSFAGILSGTLICIYHYISHASFRPWSTFRWSDFCHQRPRRMRVRILKALHEIAQILYRIKRLSPTALFVLGVKCDGSSY